MEAEANRLSCMAMSHLAIEEAHRNARSLYYQSSGTGNTHDLKAPMSDFVPTCIVENPRNMPYTAYPSQPVQRVFFLENTRSKTC